jgi:transposase InsO family protein
MEQAVEDRGGEGIVAKHGAPLRDDLVGDTTELLIGGTAKLYLAAILDLYSRFVVGWALSAVNDRHLTLRALDVALKRRCPEAGLLHHSDPGPRWTSESRPLIDRSKPATTSGRPRPMSSTSSSPPCASRSEVSFANCAAHI